MADSPGPESIPLRTRLPAMLPLGAVWVAALLPVVFYLLHWSDPELVVSLAITAKRLVWQAMLVVAAAVVVGLLLYPPLPAWLRRFVDRTRTKWSSDSAPLTQALSELKHFETAQKHYEVARLAWTRSDYRLVGGHARRSVELEATMPHAQHLLGQFLLRMKSLPEARNAFEAAERLDQGHAFGEALLHVAHLQHLTGDLDAALTTFVRHEREHGSSPRSNFWRGDALMAKGQVEAAAAAFVAAAADPKTRLTAEENWFRAQARVRCWRIRGGKAASSEGHR